MSTFMGLETARRALSAQQYALYTTGHNISNAKTPGYSRQRVNFEPAQPFPGAGMNKPRIPGQVGTGVNAGSVQRIRDQFLDVRYRNEANQLGYWATRLGSLEGIEDVTNELKEDGISNQIGKFWESLQELQKGPEARAVVKQRGIAVAEAFKYQHKSITTLQKDHKSEIEVAQTSANSIIRQLDSINEQIRSSEVHGFVTNDLYDEQDRLLDELSLVVNISVKREESGGQASKVAEGAVTVYLLDADGNRMKDGNGTELKLIDGTGTETRKGIDVQYDGDVVTGFDIKELAADFGFVKEADGTDKAAVMNSNVSSFSKGAMVAYVEAVGYKDVNGDVKGVYPEMLARLDEMALQFATEFNNVHNIGFTLKGERGGDFFSIDPTNPAASIGLSKEIEESTDNIAAAGVNLDGLTDTAKTAYVDLMNKLPKDSADYQAIKTLLDEPNSFKPGAPKSFAGDSSNAQRLADVKDTELQFSDKKASISTFYQGVIGEMAVKTQEAGRMTLTKDSMLNNVENSRKSVSNVSLDEEMTMMIQFQHAYNAAARNITMVDEMLDRIINQMGTVGR